MSIQRVSVVAHDGKEHAVSVATTIRARLEAGSVEVVDERPDLVVSIGGDGTMLRAAKLAHAADALLLGVNVGTLGYLTEVEAADAVDALDSTLDGRHQVEDRLMVGCHLRGPGRTDSFVGLNEVLVERSSGHRLLRLEVDVSGERLAALNADGVLVATPSGSTAYALSAGGPIVSPRASCLVLTPVNAHMIFSRPFVLAADETVTIRLRGEGPDAALVLDGTRAADVTMSDEVVVERHPRPLRLVKLSGPGFIQRLRVKLGLPSEAPTGASQGPS